jgi:hypothetical protein
VTGAGKNAAECDSRTVLRGIAGDSKKATIDANCISRFVHLVHRLPSTIALEHQRRNLSGIGGAAVKNIMYVNIIDRL